MLVHGIYIHVRPSTVLILLIIFQLELMFVLLHAITLNIAISMPIS